MLLSRTTARAFPRVRRHPRQQTVREATVEQEMSVT